MNRTKVASELLRIAKSLTSGDYDDLDAVLQIASNKLLAQVALGKVDAKKVAAAEMANRGLDKNGKWVGFDEAAKIWKVG